MLIYTGNSDGKKLEKVVELDLGIMISSSANKAPSKSYNRVPCALDNGAFSCWQRGFPFMENVFLDTLQKAHKNGLRLGFIVCPDIVAGGLRSLKFSLKWLERFESASNMAIAVQDGMSPRDLDKIDLLGSYPNISFLFVGGTVDWKWETAESWINYAHDNGKGCHIGRCGTLDKLQAAYLLGADSVDSTNFARNESWSTIEAFYEWKESIGNPNG